MQKFAQIEGGDSTALRPLESLVRWAISEPVVLPFHGTSRPMPDVVDYRFVNGWVATGDLPCREALRSHVRDRAVALSDCPPLPNIHVGGEDPRVDFSTFRFTPDLITRWGRTTLWATARTTAIFEAETCGSLHVWAGDRLVLRHEPFQRNSPQVARFPVDLEPGAHVFTIRLEDLHERDTSCFFRLTLVAGEGLGSAAPDPKVEAAQAIMAALRTDRMIYREGWVCLVSDAASAVPVAVRLQPGTDGSVPMTLGAGPSRGSGQVVIDGIDRAAPLVASEALPPGCIGLDLVAEVDGIQIARVLGATIFPPPDRIDGPGLSDRKATARHLIGEADGRTPSRALVLFAAGRVAEAVQALEPALAAIEGRHDCADFFLLPVLRIWRDHAADLPASLQVRVRAAILGFRYWLDEPGNDVMWFWSENHALCFHAAQYLAGHLFPDDAFAASGRTGRDQARIGAGRLGRWFDAVEVHGFAEWNSAAYYPIDFVGLLSLVDMAADADIAGRARRQCDRLFTMIALHTIGGTPAGSQGRAYEKELFAGPATELGALAAVAFGGPFVRGFERAAALLAVSDYAPPPGLDTLRDVPPGRSLIARYTQGLDHTARLTLWKSDAAQLSSIADHRTGDAGHQQHVVDLAMAADPFARVWVNHPGDLKPWGGSRPSLWAGSGVVPRVAQEANTALLVFDLDRQSHPIGFTHAMVPLEVFDEVLTDGHWIFARKDAGYCALWASTRPLRQDRGLYAGSEYRVHARQAGWLVIAGAASVHGSFSAFRAQAMASRPSFDAAGLRLTAGDLSLAHDGPLCRAGQPVAFQPLSIRPHLGWDGAPLSPFGQE